MSNGHGAAKVNTLLFFLVGLLSGGIIGYILGGTGQAPVMPGTSQPAVSLDLNDVVPVQDVWIVEGFSCPAPGCTNPLLSCQDELARRIRDWVNSQRAAGRSGDDIRAEIIRVHGEALNKLPDASPPDTASANLP